MVWDGSNKTRPLGSTKAPDANDYDAIVAHVAALEELIEKSDLATKLDALKPVDIAGAVSAACKTLKMQVEAHETAIKTIKETPVEVDYARLLNKPDIASLRRETEAIKKTITESATMIKGFSVGIQKLLKSYEETLKAIEPVEIVTLEAISEKTIVVDTAEYTVSLGDEELICQTIPILVLPILARPQVTRIFGSAKIRGQVLVNPTLLFNGKEWTLAK